jgi:signal transduction histidine kinase
MIINSRPLVIPGIILIVFLICAGCTQVQAPAPDKTLAPANVTETVSPATTIVSPNTSTKEEMVAFVQEAVSYARQNGKEKALAEFSSRNGSFFRGDLYVYAYDKNGTTLAHPVNPEKIGVNRLNETDADGNQFIRDLRQAATNGTGFVTYTYINPTHNNSVEKKLGYVMSVDNTWWLGSGIYLEPAQALLHR